MKRKKSMTEKKENAGEAVQSTALVDSGGETVPAVPKITSTLDLMAFAVQSKSGVDQLERLMAMKNQEEERNARKDFFEALSKFQELVGPILKEKTVNFETSRGVTNYRHASLGQIELQIKGPMREVGLSRRFEIKNEDGGQVVTCIITHVNGHSERTSMEAPADTSGSKNAIQSLGSTVTYLQRYTLIGALGLVTADEDNDGRTSDSPASKPVVKKAANGVIIQNGPVDNIPHEVRPVDTRLQTVIGKLKKKDPKTWTNDVIMRELGERGATRLSELSEKDANELCILYEKALAEKGPAK